MKKASSNSIESSPISTWPSTSTTTTFWSAMQANYVAVASNKILLTPVCMALMVYINSLHGDFVHDDIPAIVRNPDVNGQNRHMFQALSNDFWGEPMSSVRSHKSYRPLTILIFRLNHYFGGGGQQTWPFHGTNLILHGCATFLLRCICKRTLQLSNFTTWTATSLFALHPIHTEAVSGLVGCADLLACNLTLLSFLAYTKYLENPAQEVKWHWLSLCFASGAVLSKETGIMSLAINVGYGLLGCIQQKYKYKTWKNTFKRLFWTDIFTLLAIFSVRILVQSSSLPEFSAQDNPAAFDNSLLTRTLTFLYLPAYNFWLMLCPSSLSYDWQMGSLPLIRTFKDFRAFLVLPTFYSALIFLPILQYFRNKKSINEPVIVSYLFLILPFLPASNLFFPVGFVVAERILYLPSIGFCLLVALGAERLSSAFSSLRCRASASAFMSRSSRGGVSKKRKRSPSQSSMSSTSSLSSNSSSLSSKKSSSSISAKRITRQKIRLRRRLRSGEEGEVLGQHTNVYFLALFSTLLLLFALKTWTRNYDWNSRRDLFRSGLKSQPENAKVHYNYANVLKENGQQNVQAIKHYREALRLWPDYVLAHNNLATLLEDRDSSIVHLRRALAIDPWHPTSLYNMAVLYREHGDCALAIPLLEKCIGVGETKAYPLLSDCLLRGGQAESKLTKASETEESNMEIPEPITENNLTNGGDDKMAAILSHLAEFYMSLEEWSKAEMTLQKILKTVDSEHEVALYQLSQVYLEQNQTGSALEAIRAASKNGCKNGLSSNQNYKEILGPLSQKCIWGPKCMPKAHLCAQIVIQEADILRARRQYQMAAQRYNLALEMSPPSRAGELLLNLGSVHHAMGDWELAEQHYTQCLALEPNNQVVIANMKLLSSQLN